MFPNPQPLMRYAADKAQFQRATDYYPGVRAPCPSAYTDIVRNRDKEAFRAYPAATDSSF